MKKLSQIMNEMGFRKDAPDSVKEAFLKHLIKASTGADVETPTEKHKKRLQQQLSLFDWNNKKDVG